ncbi:3'-5' exonuclease [Azoarcus indigens]|uniref:DNA polymerase-3 subunit epsilon n=1 Tax=Azoarcus indigens TaxID=29545 RepID=A0A4R6DVH2_9RHOO|nr:3'-5' exonuclease [Azoarcus indigens]NMG64337.1 3'-5' exonuclease [Azoarcus indigens]TDN49211.1 DNA polymerase-3 subunit epsilon [Azoarcus indigens]
MKPIFFYDTETTGLPDFKAPSEAAHQPHLVQLAALLVDPHSRETIASMDVIVRPLGWTIPDDVATVHGITTEQATAVGVSESIALGLFLDLWGCAGVRIGHNEQFDARIIRIAQHRFDCGDLDAWKGAATECTARLATPICQIPPTDKMVKAGFTKFKTPNLSEAYRHFTGLALQNAHSAMADVMACRDIYFAILDQKVAA